MGCLVELLGEFLFELVFSALFYVYYGLMSMIVPSRVSSEKTKKRMMQIIKIVTATFVVLLMVAGILMLLKEPIPVLIGKIILCLVLSVSALQILLGIIVVILTRKKNKWRKR